MNGDETLKKIDPGVLDKIDPGTGLTLDELIDAFVSNPIEAKNLKNYIVNEAEKHTKEEK